MIEYEEDAYDEMIEHARAGKPYEVCGVLGGDRESGVVRAIYPVENVSETPETNYLMEPEEQLRTIDAVEDDGLDVLGFYHSHPEGPEEPSETDAERANWPDHSYVIVSLRDDDPFVGSWRWTGDGFDAQEVRVHDSD